MERQAMIEEILQTSTRQLLGGLAFQVPDDDLRRYVINKTMKHVGPILETTLALLSTDELEEYYRFMTSKTVAKVAGYLQSPEVQQSMQNAIAAIQREMAND